jgi:hypothetical protein
MSENTLHKIPSRDSDENRAFGILPYPTRRHNKKCRHMMYNTVAGVPLWLLVLLVLFVLLYLGSCTMSCEKDLFSSLSCMSDASENDLQRVSVVMRDMGACPPLQFNRDQLSPL